MPHSLPFIVLSMRRPLAVSSRRLVVASPLVAPSSRPLVVLSLRHPLVILRQLVAVLPLVVPSSPPLIALPSRPLVARRLVVAWPPSNTAAAIWPPSNTAAAIEPPPPPPLHAIFIIHHQHRLRHLHCQTLHRHPLSKKEASAPPPPAYQWQHHCEHVYKSRQLDLFNLSTVFEV